jgi:transcriptional regulator with XRE-family HTH domain
MTTQLDLTLGEVLLVWRTRAGFTQAEMGKAIEVSRNTVARWEAGQGRMRWRDVEAWAAACEQAGAELVHSLWVEAMDARPRMGRPPRTEVTHRSACRRVAA